MQSAQYLPSRMVLVLPQAGHTFAVNSLRAGDDIKTLQENMGHFSAAFTLDRYGHVTEEMRKASSKRMQAFIENLEGKN